MATSTDSSLPVSESLSAPLSAPSDSTPLVFLLLSSLLTPLALVYLLVIPARYPKSRWSSARSAACVEGAMAFLWAASSVASAVNVTEEMCIGGVCTMAQGVVVLGVFQW